MCFWESPEQVLKFASRAPDRRLLELLDAVAEPARYRVLDLGCAGGRNAAVLAERGFDFHAIDTSEAMVLHTRKRVAQFLGPDSARERVQVGRMEDLTAFPNETFDLIVALGVYHNATDHRDFEAALQDTARVARVGAVAVVANFDPRTDPTGSGVHPVPGELHAFDGFPSGRVYMMGKGDLDDAFRRYGFRPAVETETVRVDTARGRRVTVNALYRKG